MLAIGESVEDSMSATNVAGNMLICRSDLFSHPPFHSGRRNDRTFVGGAAAITNKASSDNGPILAVYDKSP